MQSNVRELSTVEELNQAIAESDTRPVLLFKHSNSCPISARGFREFNSYMEEADPVVSYNLITVQLARPVSNEAAELLNIEHETPQAILIRNRSGIWSASHYDITSTSIREAIEAARAQQPA